MLSYWPFSEVLGAYRNYGNISYGAQVEKRNYNYCGGNFYWSGNISMTFSGIGGELFNQRDVSVGLINLKHGQIPYLRHGPTLYKPDSRFANTGVNWGLSLTKENFADKEYTLKFYSNDTLIYTNGTPQIILSGEVYFPLANNFREFKVFEGPIEGIFGPKNFMLFGSSSGSVASGFSLYMPGGDYDTINTGIQLSLFAGGENCYLLSEQGEILLDELGNPLYAEGCTVTYGFYAGFDLVISGTNEITSGIPLYLHQEDTGYSLVSGFPLFMESKNPISNYLDLFVSNSLTETSGGVSLYIEASGLNDGYTPISSGFPLYIARADNTYDSINLFISGAVPQITGGINLTLEATTYPISGGLNLSIPYTNDTIQSGINLYTIGW